MFVVEGDNREDARAMASAATSLLGRESMSTDSESCQTHSDAVTTFKEPKSWSMGALYGQGINQALFG
jgi:hypothetical protein